MCRGTIIVANDRLWFLTDPSLLEAMRRSRVVADDWLVAIDSNRYPRSSRAPRAITPGSPWRMVNARDSR
jgi:hypothetical protein